MLLLILMADLFYREPLYQLTLDYVPDWQSMHTRDHSTIVIMRVLTYLGEGYAGAVIFGLAFVFASRDRAFYVLFAHTMAANINKNLKLIYRNPRPYMIYPEVQTFGCSKSFGTPSGHSSLTACLYTTIFLLAFHDKIDHYAMHKRSLKKLR